MELEKELRIEEWQYIDGEGDVAVLEGDEPFFTIEFADDTGITGRNFLHIPKRTYKKYHMEINDDSVNSSVYMVFESAELETSSPPVKEIIELPYRNLTVKEAAESYSKTMSRRLEESLSEAVKQGTEVSIIGGNKKFTIHGVEKAYDEEQIESGYFSIGPVDKIISTSWCWGQNPLRKEDRFRYRARFHHMADNPELVGLPLIVEITEQEYEQLRQLPANAVMRLKDLGVRE